MRRTRRGRDGERGQGLVEFAMIVPVFMLILLGLLELGFVFDHVLTISYATREGARTGAALANGAKLADCNDVDKYVVAAVERVLDSPGSPIEADLSRVTQIRIFKATSAGAETSAVNVWVPGAGPSVDGKQLSYRAQSTSWASCGSARNNQTRQPRLDRRRDPIHVPGRHPAGRRHAVLRRARLGHASRLGSDGHGPQPAATEGRRCP